MVRRIADGSFGLVYQMKSKVTQGLVAAKRLKHRKPEDVYFSRKEVHILSKISGGPGVVALIDYFESPAQSVIIIALRWVSRRWISNNFFIFFGSGCHQFISIMIQVKFIVKVFNKGWNQGRTCFFLLLMYCRKIRNCLKKHTHKKRKLRDCDCNDQTFNLYYN